MAPEDVQSDPLSETLAVFDRAERAREPLTTSEVSESLSCTRRTAYDRLTRLADRGVVETKKVGARGRIWWREPQSSETGAEAQSAVVEHDSLLLDVLDEADVGVFVLNDEFEVVWVNDDIERYFGLDRTAVVGRDKRRLLDEEILDTVANPGEFAETVRSTYDDNTYAEEFECRVTAGEHRPERWLEHRSRPIESGRFAGGRVELYYDVTESKRLFRRLSRSHAALERELDDVFERIDDAVFALDDDHRFTYLNRRAERLFDCDASDVVGRSVTDVFAAADDSTGYDAIRRASETQSSVTYEEYFEPLDVWLEGRVYPSETGVSVYVRNADERKQREREQKRYETIFETIDDAVCVFDEDGRLVATNSAFETLTGHSAGDFLDETGRLATDDTLEGVIERYRERSRGGEDTVSVETEATTDGGERVVIESRITRYRSAEGSLRWIAVVRDVTERKEQLRRHERQQERLTALNAVNAVVREISDAIISRPTREEIEREVCTAFAESESYRFAWIAGVDPRRGELTARVEVGVEGYVDEIDLSDARSLNTLEESGPASRAVRTGEIQAVNDPFSDEDFEPWRHLARKYDYQSVAAVPIEYEGTTYGLLGVYADRENAFEEEEQRALEPVGEIVGHAIAANERKQALMGDEAVEVEFRVPNPFGEYGATLPSDGTFRIERTVPLEDGTYLEYGVASAHVLDVLESLVDVIPHWRSLARFDCDSSPARFELYLSEQPVQSAIASLGGYVESAAMADGDFELTVHLSVSTDIRSVTDRLRETYPNVELVARRLVSVEDPFRERLQRQFSEILTERQRTAVETAYYSGFFEWPRESTGEDVAESLGVSAPTFHQHLRRAEKELFGQVLAEQPVTDQ
ncbi:PAS domain S-box-containing protein [Halopelagius inordinatus]|uniref:PAS domain S-box-containing protein n=1 Tax=Halopelagius inordinatus TaxID=553467 RepID=A0A1I2NIN1_9EURY|nr:PAS domain S-box protein [Halopelagius inordinatus]SFG01547.1 PAS domain S-box-containing protein [Halopelagius inordinatus]